MTASFLHSYPGLRLGTLLLLSAPVIASAHDLMASHVIARFRPEVLELQIKVAADVAWPLVQESSPGAIFVSEDFDKVGRPLLLALAKKMDSLRVNGKPVESIRTDVVVAEDTFLFAFTYPLPSKGTLQLTEGYLSKMSPEYLSHIRVFDQTGALVTTKELSKEKPSLELPFSIDKAESPSTATPAVAKP